MLLRTYSCSFRTAKTKLFLEARSAAVLQYGRIEFYHLVRAILRCGSVFRLQKKTWIPNFHLHTAEGDTTAASFAVPTVSEPGHPWTFPLEKQSIPKHHCNSTAKRFITMIELA